MFPRRRDDQPVPTEWEQRIAAARALIEQQRPPSWVLARLDEFGRAVADADGDRRRLRASLERLDVERAGRELKAALRQDGRTDEHQRLVSSLRQRYETIHALTNRAEQLDVVVERALADIDVLAARAVLIGRSDDAWRLDETLRRLDDDLTALERAHAELADL
jgi:seryl-tRNA synthetase